MMSKIILIICLCIGSFVIETEASENDKVFVRQIHHVTAKVTWLKKMTKGGSFRKLPQKMQLNKVRYSRAETRYFFSIADVGPGWNNFRLVPFLPEKSDLSVTSQKGALLRLGLPMLEIEKDNYMEWRYISVAGSNEANILYVAMTFDSTGGVKESRIGTGKFIKIEFVHS